MKFSENLSQEIWHYILSKCQTESNIKQVSVGFVSPCRKEDKMSKTRVELNWQFQIDYKHPLSHGPEKIHTSKRKTLNTGIESETRRARGDLKVEGDADSVWLELLHDLGERCIGLEDEALGADDGEVEPRALVERDA